MSRLAFRAALETPRPRSALVLVALASLTLAVSGHIEPLVLALQAAALVTAAAFRHAPRAWQHRALWLNALLAAGALLALAAAARGAPASVGLAQLALLASGIQVLDARPRRSEFLLVGLALFQVVLASSLTDSLLFPPLLMAFLPTCVWTLLVHTLRSEALEAGDPAAATDAITPGLLGMTLAASGLSLVLALALFFLLPRLHEGLVRAGGSAHQALGGFSDHVDLGDFGRIRADPTMMLRVETLEGTPPRPEDAYWRGLAFDRFDGRSWSMTVSERTPLEGDAATGIALAWHADRADLVQRILREPMASGVLFGAGEPVQLQGGTGRLERDGNGGLYAPESGDARIRYEVSVHAAVAGDDVLARDVAAPPEHGERFLALPDLPPEITALAQQIVDGAANDLGRARALEHWLRSKGHYSDTPPQEVPGDPRTPLERFLLGERSGHCEYFASAMVVMARSVGLPARLVNGFAGGHRNRIGDFVELSGSDAHAWVELHFRDHGWMRFDPTPPDLRLAAAESPSLRERLGDLHSAIELFWFQQVVEFDRGHQVRAVLGAWRTLRGWLPQDEAAPGAAPRPGWLARLDALPRLLPAVVGCAVLATFLVLRRLRAPRRGRPVPLAYAHALRLLSRRGFLRPLTRTPRAFAREVAGRLSPAGAAAFSVLTEAYLVERYGGRAAPAGEAELRALRDSLRA